MKTHQFPRLTDKPEKKEKKSKTVKTDKVKDNQDSLKKKALKLKKENERIIDKLEDKVSRLKEEKETLIDFICRNERSLSDDIRYDSYIAEVVYNRVKPWYNKY